MLSRVQLFVTPWTVAYQTPLSMEFSRQEHWSELPFPSPGDLPDPGTEPTSPVSFALAGGFFIAKPHRKPNRCSSVQFSRSIVSDPLRPHESKYARPPCPLPTPRVHSNSRSSSR